MKYKPIFLLLRSLFLVENRIFFSYLFSLSNFCENIKQNEENWKAFYTSTNPIEMTLPEPYDSTGGSGSELLKLLIFKCLRPDAIQSAIEKFICSFDETMEFNPSEQVNVKSAFACSTSKTPLIYFTSTGIDAMADILSLAHENHSGEK